MDEKLTDTDRLVRAIYGADSPQAKSIRPKKCHEVLRVWSSPDQYYVCEYAYGQPHTHTEVKHYMRPLAADEEISAIDSKGCVWLKDSLAHQLAVEEGLVAATAPFTGPPPRKESSMDKTIQYEFVIDLPITVFIQPEEMEEIRAAFSEKCADYRRRGLSTSGLSIAREIMEQSKALTMEVLKVGRVQHEGALMVVESRESQ